MFCSKWALISNPIACVEHSSVPSTNPVTITGKCARGHRPQRTSPESAFTPSASPFVSKVGTLHVWSHHGHEQVGRRCGCIYIVLSKCPWALGIHGANICGRLLHRVAIWTKDWPYMGKPAASTLWTSADTCELGDKESPTKPMILFLRV